MTRLGRLAVLVSVSIFIAVPALAEVIHGTATLHLLYVCEFGYYGGSALDAETRTIVTYSAPEADLSLAAPVNDCYGRFYFWFRNDATGGFVGGPVEALTTAPDVGGWYMDMPPLNEACVLRTAGGIYMKFAVRAVRLETQQADIEYYVQTDGTPEFGPVLPVATKSWGGIKALYR